jgi:hypothetical protein
MDLGTLDATASGVTVTTAVPFVFIGSVIGGPVTTHTHFTDGILPRRAELSIPLI